VGAATDHGVRPGPARADRPGVCRRPIEFGGGDRLPDHAADGRALAPWLRREALGRARRRAAAGDAAPTHRCAGGASDHRHAGEAAPRRDAIHTCLIFGPRVRHGLPRTCHGEPRRGIEERSWRLSGKVRSAVSARLVWVARRDRSHAPGRAATSAGIGVGCRRAIIAFDVLRFADRTDLRLGCAFRHAMAIDGVQNGQRAVRGTGVWPLPPEATACAAHARFTAATPRRKQPWANRPFAGVPRRNASESSVVRVQYR
jgi:hypothetical protein